MATIQYTGVFALLIAEVVTFLTLIIPFPNRWKRSVFTWASRSPVVKKIIYGVKIAFVFVFVLFCDAVVRLNKVRKDRSSHHIIDDHALCQFKVQQFYAQRNTYLTGITMFLGLILVSTYALIGQMLETDNQVDSLRKEATTSKAKSGETLKKQAQTTHDEYMRLSDECEALRKKLSAENESKKDA
ncbi:B-cell receptor-associated 31-like protein [Linderina pennispora]|uniref:Endoplasmic reticulum transmembrane protein n=1 Tax=Linderina pennispora TaxID=61395 RepID=A0A1Y1W340_9FUNG|nr:B-cell receptor-associated 31-like protein [Linderina pennispora]ORX67908.1 B-cell receptor-associated 31-like protein [Linderina pennispora]